MACFVLGLPEKGEAIDRNEVLGRSLGLTSFFFLPRLGSSTSGINMILEKRNFSGHGANIP